MISEIFNLSKMRSLLVRSFGVNQKNLSRKQSSGANFSFFSGNVVLADIRGFKLVIR